MKKVLVMVALVMASVLYTHSMTVGKLIKVKKR